MPSLLGFVNTKWNQAHKLARYNVFLLIRITTASSLLCLCSCGKIIQPTQVPLPKINWQQQQQLLTEFNHWQQHARVGIISSQSATNAGWQWQQKDKNFYLRLSGPLNLGGYQVTGDSDKIEIIDNEGKHLDFTNSEQRYFFESLIKYAPHWVKGLPAAGVAITKQSFHEFGGLANLQQAGWSINYLEYQVFIVSGKQIVLPKKIIFQFIEPSGKLIKVKLVISNWKMTVS